MKGRMKVAGINKKKRGIKRGTGCSSVGVTNLRGCSGSYLV